MLQEAFSAMSLDGHMGTVVTVAILIGLLIKATK